MAVVGGGVVGAATTLALARRGVAVTLLEAEDRLGLGASGTNSGILHTGFDSPPGELETRLILRSAELRGPVLARLAIPVLRCGAVLRPRTEEDRATVAALAKTCVETELDEHGVLHVPGEAVTDPVAYTTALAASAAASGAEVVTGARVEAIERSQEGLSLGLASGDRLRCRMVVNCAGLYADEVARLAGDDSFEIYPRKGEFFVFEPPDGKRLERILLPVPTKRTKGVLVFPTLDTKVVVGPTAHDQDDKEDWSVRDDAWSEVMPRAIEMLPTLEGAEPVAAYAGLRPAGRGGANYAIGPSRACPGLINVAAIRSTGLTASLGIAEHVTGLVGQQGVALVEERPLQPAAPPEAGGPWWRRTAEHRRAAT
ncbi:MAG: NAD(P)/FAD-dependent oxidoreductase [Thermoleophilaceae bacterium]